jgi:eukaryotic-like serine/threonine-protein kinase
MEAIMSAPDKTTLPLPPSPGDAPVEDSDGTTVRDPNSDRETPLESTEPSVQRGAAVQVALGHVRLDSAERPGSIGRVGHYEIIDVIGHGAMGVVVRAIDTQLSRTVAIKLMSPQLMLNPQARERFFREARAAAGINHPNVITIHAVSEHTGVPFLVMEFVAGRTLMERIRLDAPLKPVDILRISVQIAGGLAAAHQQGVIHRDIKPANIMLEGSVERVKIADFGLARVMLEQSDLTSQGALVGTPSYMSPEQVNGERLDPRSDLFSLGCVMYAMTAGSSPFRGENALATARRVTSQTHISLGDVSKDVPSDFVRIVDRLLEKDPKDRYQSASALAEDLTGLLAKLNRAPDTIPDVPAPRAAGRIRARRIILGVLSLVVAVATLALLWQRNTAKRDAVTALGLATLRPAASGVIRVAQRGESDFTSLGEAVRRAAPGSTIRVEDAAVYDEPLSLLGSSRLANLRLEATAGATLKAPAGRPVLTVDRAAKVKISGFQIEAASGQHAIELRGSCPGTLVENCQIVCAPDSPVAAVYLHAGARGTPDDPILLRGLRIKCGGVGVVMGGLEDSERVSQVELTDSLITGPGRDYGVGIVLQVGVSQISVRRNILSTDTAGISLSFELPDHALDVVIAQNSLANVRYALALNDSSPKQGIQITGNLIVDADTVQVSAAGIDATPSWFRENWWERSPNVDESIVSHVAKLIDPLPLRSRDPESANYLKPATSADPIPGRYSTAPEHE